MDGNRRYAKSKNKIESEGHGDGYIALENVLQTCLGLGVKCVSVFAFSVENFGREGIDDLMKLAWEKMNHLASQHQYGVRVYILGELHMLPMEVQTSAYNLMKSTELHSNYILNIHLAYSTRYELLHYFETGMLYSSVPVDIMIRTSGETRLSDYMIEHCANAKFVFVDVYWPEFGARLFWIVLKWQLDRYCQSLK